jgi:hypothetical protein
MCKCRSNNREKREKREKREGNRIDDYLAICFVSHYFNQKFIYKCI